MSSKGPSPVIPTVMVGILSLVIFGATSSTFLLIPLFLWFLIKSLTPLFPSENKDYFATNQRKSVSYDPDAEGSAGLGTFLLFLLYIILYNVMKME